MRAHVRWVFLGSKKLFVVGDDGFEEIAEPLIAAHFIFAGDLQQQSLDLIHAAKRMARDGIRQSGAKHDELMLALILRRANGPTNSAIKPSELGAGGRIHVANSTDNGMRLVIEIEAVGNQLLEVDLLDFKTALAAGTTITSRAAPFTARSAIARTAITPAFGTRSAIGRSSGGTILTRTRLWRTPFTQRAILLRRLRALGWFRCLFFCHVSSDLSVQTSFDSRAHSMATTPAGRRRNCFPAAGRMFRPTISLIKCNRSF